MALGQRLVPALCPDSKEAIAVDGAIKVMVDKQLEGIPQQYRQDLVVPEKLYRAQRSATCPGGTRGRLGVFEVLEMTKEIEDVLLKNPIESEIERVARAGGLTTMRDDALFKAFEGLIPFEEVAKL